MLWWSQIVVGLIYALEIFILLQSYRRQDAMQNSLLLGILLSVAGLMVPETVLMVPLCWVSLFALRANNFRTILASLIGVAVVAIYIAIIWLIWPDGALIQGIVGNWSETFARSFGILSQPLWMVIVTVLLALLGFIYQISHLSRYASANVRIQIRILLVIPGYWLSLLSCVFPADSGNALLSVQWMSAIYLIVLYHMTYGMPRLSNPFAHRSNPYNRSFSRHSRRRR